MKRKTFDVDQFVAWANSRLAQSNFGDKDSTDGVGFRKGVFTAIEQVLQEANRYAGFSYIAPEHAETKDGWGYDYKNRAWNDDSRRIYHVKSITYRGLDD